MFDKHTVHVAMHREGVVGRRGFLRRLGAGAGALAALSFTDLLAVHADELRKKQKSVILLWMGGGPSQLETFDPKPDHANGNGTKVISTKLPGVAIAEGWDKTAATLDKIALIRSMTNKEGNHQRATYQLHTGYAPTATLKHPSFGSNVAHRLAPEDFDLPHVVRVASGRGAAGLGLPGAGFLGMAYEPFSVENPEQPPRNVTVPVPADRFTRRLGLLDRLETAGFARTGGADRVRDHKTLYEQSSRMVLSPRMDTFDLEGEPSELRDAYGRNGFGQGCLLARRLVETGVTFVEVLSPGNWDTHRDQAERLGELVPQVDAGFATLVNDLHQRGRLDDTLVVWMGEFGRTPKPNNTGGRDHFPRAFNVAVAGCGIKGGQVIGATNPAGTEVVDTPVTVSDLLSSFCQALGIDPSFEHMSPVGRPIKVVDGGSPVARLFG